MADDNELDISLDTVMNPSITDVNTDETDLSKIKDESKKDTTTTTNTDINIDEINSVLNLVSRFNSDEISEEDKLLKEDILKEFKGSSFDEKGNILDENGNIITSYKDFEKFINEEEEIKLDDNGNQINDKGEIIKTALQIAEESTVVNKLRADSGYEFKDENGNVKIYSDDEKGIEEFTNDVVEEKFESFKSNFFNQHPELTEVAKHLISGGTLDTFVQEVDYSTIDISKLDEEGKIKYIKQSYISNGVPSDQAEELIELFKDSNRLDKEIQKAIPNLIKHQETIKEERDANYQQKIEEQNRQIIQHWNNVEEVVNKGVLKDITIPEKDKEGFFEYISNAVDANGNSQNSLDAAKEPLEQQLMVQYLRYKGYDLTKLVNTKANNDKVLSLRERIQRSSKDKTTTSEQKITTSSTSGDNVSIDSLLSK